MSDDQNAVGCVPPIGMAAWLLSGGRMVDRIEWMVDNGFTGVALSQSAMDITEEERKDAAAAITSAELSVTYHGNVQHKLTHSGELEEDFARRMIDDVIWWHENTNGVSSCCSDSINTARDDGWKAFDFDMNKRHIDAMAKRLVPYGIRVGIENSFGGEDRLCAIDDIARFGEMCSGSGIGLLFDAGHANVHVRSDGIEGEDEISGYVNGMPLEILEIHLCDNLGERDEHKRIGYGNLDLDSLFQALKRMGYSGQLTVEVCVDILSGKYGSDITNSKQTDALLTTQARIRDAWSALT